MLQIDKIQDKLLHLIGWKQSSNSLAGVSISKYLAKSESGLYFQQAHPLITLDNLNSVAPDFSVAEALAAYPEYDTKDNTCIYNKGEVVKVAGKLYKATRDNIAANTNINDPAWAETTLFSEWLEEKVKSSISRVIVRFVTEKYAASITKPILENKALFDGTGRLSDTINNADKIVGFEIVPIRANGITLKVNRLGMQFTEPGTYTFYFMHSSCAEPIYTIVSEQPKKGFAWVTVDKLLKYSNDTLDVGGSWYLCYKQAELPAGSKAVNKDIDWSKGPCKSCSRNSFISWQAWSKFLEIHPFAVNDNFDDISLWDVAEMEYAYNTNWGLNLDISIYCDLTDFIIQERHLFTDVIMKQFAVDMLREFAYNPNVRTNRHSINASRMDILYELDGDSASLKKSGLSYQLEQAFKAINLSTQGLDRVCLPCKNNGIKYRTI